MWATVNMHMDNFYSLLYLPAIDTITKVVPHDIDQLWSPPTTPHDIDQLSQGQIIKM